MKDKKDTAQNQPAQLKLVLPEALRQEIKVRAAMNMRTMSSEVVYLIQSAIRQQTQGAPA